METTVRIDKYGRFVLPAHLGRALGIRGPASLKAEMVGNRVELTLLLLQRKAVLKKRKGLLVVHTGGRKFDAFKAVRAMRGEPW
jgi:bifunctional DNA-binding transcriptional regulator/antitoxin component of YhaV-PrlF toxin-antitoxin module